MINIAILGFGVVGGGVAQVLSDNKSKILAAAKDEINVKYIFDKRTFEGTPYADKVTTDFDKIVNDDEVSVIVETMGGVHPAFEFSLAAFAKGKTVITSNKEVVAKCGVKLTSEAAKNGASYLFEAAVGGGIPVIRSMRTSLCADNITSINGILNGTTNYILTAMARDGSTFDTALDEARKLGYAEANPSADIDGLDTQRKIMILTALASGIMLDEASVPTETMSRITTEDISAAARASSSIKLIGSARITENGVGAYVYPFFVPTASPLSHIDGVYNGVSVSSPVTGDLMYYGRGAGRYPTAGAIVSDIVAAANHSAKYEAPTVWHEATENEKLSADSIKFSYYVRVKTDLPNQALEAAKNIFGDITVIPSERADAAEYITAEISENEAKQVFANASLGGELESRIRVLK